MSTKKLLCNHCKHEFYCLGTQTKKIGEYCGNFSPKEARRPHEKGSFIGIVVSEVEINEPNEPNIWIRVKTPSDL